MYITYKTYFSSSFMAEWSASIAAPSSVPVKVLNPYFEAVACLEQKRRMESKRYFGREPTMVNVSYTKQQIDWLCQNSDSWVIAFAHLKDRLIIFSQLIHC